MSLIEKALEQSEIQGNSEGRKIYTLPINHRRLHVKKNVNRKILLTLVLLSLLMGTGIFVYQKNTKLPVTEDQKKGDLVTKAPLKRDLDTMMTSKSEVVATISLHNNEEKDYIEKVYTKGSPGKTENEQEKEKATLASKIAEKEPSTSLNEEEEIPTLVKIETEIKSLDPTHIKKKEPTPPSQDQLLNTHYNHAVTLEKGGKLKEAVLEYERALALNPNHSKSHNNLGNVYYKLGKFNLAVESYKKALAINPQYVKAHNNLGIVLFQLNKVKEAIDEFTRAISLDPKNIESHNNLGIIYKNIGEIEKARETFKNAFLINTKSAEIHYNLALLYESEDNIELAFIHYKKFIGLCPAKYHELKEKVTEHLFVLAKKSMLRDKK